MEISLAMILDSLSISYVNFIGEDQKTGFHHTKLLSDLVDLPSPDTIYIGTETQLKHCRLFDYKPYVLCIPEKFPFDVTNCYQTNTVYLTEPIFLQELYFLVNECFDKLNAWDFRLYNSTLNEEGLQSLLDVSEGIFRNHIHIVEPFSRLLAYTRETDIEDIDLDAMYTDNKAKSESIRELQEQIYGQIEVSEHDIILMDYNNVYVHPSVIKAVSQDGSSTIFVIMICKNRRFSEGVKDLFLHLCKYIKYYAKKTDLNKHSYISHETFFNGVLNQIFSQNALNIHATLTLKLPLKSNYNLYNIVFLESCEEDFETIMETLCHKLPNSRMARFENSLLLLNPYEQKDIRQEHFLNLRKIHKAITSSHCVCGISNPFKSLYDITHAYNQTIVALDFNNKKKMQSFPFIPFNHGEPFYHYDDFSLSHTLLEICKADPEMNSLAPYIENIIAIKEYDQMNSTKCLELLFVYLTLERNVTAAGELLHLPKENVLHYVHILESMIYADLNSWRVRVKLLMVFEYLNLTPESLLSDEIK